MKNLSTLKTLNLPSLNSSYGALDIVGNTVGRYFDYKRDTAMIEYETKKVKAEAKVMVKKIDSELTKSLDENDKNFKKEMKRLKTIAKALKRGTKDRSKIINAMLNCSDPEALKVYRLMLADENKFALQKLNLMSSFEPNTKLLGGM